MSPLCGCCGEHVNQLQQQVSVMRNEIKNLRHLLDIAVRSHRKHMTAIQTAVSKTALSQKALCEPEKHQKPSLTSPQAAALEQGRIKTVPIGYISSCFSVKNGTPRQPTICGPSKAELRLQQSIFNNPQHALLGLEQYSHVWIIFLFHKNGHLNYKAKVKPPRLNGQRVGVYSTRSPHRPNALGLTLAKLDQIVGDTIHLSNIDMIDGTPVLDIKPYIPDYDSPYTRMSADSKSDQPQETTASLKENTDILTFDKDSETDAQSDLNSETIDNDYDDMGSNMSSDQSHVLNQNKPGASCIPKDVHKLLQDVQAYVKQEDLFQLPPDKENQVSASTKAKPANSPVERLCYGAEAYSTIAGWIREAPVESLEVRFTPHAERQLAEFLPAHLPGPSESDRPRFKFLSSPDEAAAGIRGVLSADPRSVYFRTRCTHRLFFFTLDTADVTCWFGPGFAEVLNVRPV